MLKFLIATACIVVIAAGGFFTVDRIKIAKREAAYDKRVADVRNCHSVAATFVKQPNAPKELLDTFVSCIARGILAKENYPTIFKS
jgi:hypothetical protein